MSHTFAVVNRLKRVLCVPGIVLASPAIEAERGITRLCFVLVGTKRGRLILAIFARERLVCPTSRSGTIACFGNGTVLFGNLLA